MAYYVTIVDGTKKGFLVGPYKTHGAALAMVASARKAAKEVDPRSHFAGFGTAHVKCSRMRKRIGAGKLNHLVGYEPDRLP